MTEERAIDAARIDGIDIQAFREYLERLGLDLTDKPQPALESDLRARGVLADIGGEPRATLYGVLAFGRTPQSYPETSSFWVECVAYGVAGAMREHNGTEPLLQEHRDARFVRVTLSRLTPQEAGRHR